MLLIDGSARPHRFVLVQALHVFERRLALDLKLALNLAKEVFLLLVDRLIVVFVALASL